jgi:hypothetical protein
MVTNINTNTVNSHCTHKGLIGGVILIMVGLVNFLSQLGMTQYVEYFIGLLGAIFILAAFVNRKKGFLVPGGILLGLNTAILLQGFRPGDAAGAGLFMLAFAGGWLLIPVLSVILNWMDSSSRIMLWPLFPGAFFGILGGLLMDGAYGLFLLSQLSLVWPVVLILLGLWIIFRRR